MPAAAERTCAPGTGRGGGGGVSCWGCSWAEKPGMSTEVPCAREPSLAVSREGLNVAACFEDTRPDAHEATSVFSSCSMALFPHQ